jgi:hypothetical protein
VADTTENLRNWLVAKSRAGEYRVFARLEWEAMDPEGWIIVADHLTEQAAAEELVRRAPPEKRAP